MSLSMVARRMAFSCAVFLTAPALLAQAPAAKEKLPDGVKMRLGGGGLRGHHAAMSPDGKLIATSATDGPGKFKFRIVKASDGKLIYSMESKDFEHMAGCAFSHDSKLLAGNEVRDGVPQGTCLWDVAAQKSRFVLPISVQPGSAPVFSPDDKLVALRNQGRGIDVFDVATGKLRTRVPYRDNPPNHYVAIAFLPDGKTLVNSDASGNLRFWDVARGTKVREIPLKDNKFPIDALAVSPDGKLLAVNQIGDLFCVVEIDSGKELYRLPRAFAHGIAFSPDGKYLLRGVEGEDRWPDKSRIELLETATGKELGRVPLAGWGAKSIQFTADGKTLMACGNDLYVRIWSFRDLKPRLERVGHASRVEALVFSPDGKMLCSREELDRFKRIFWDVATGQPRHIWSDMYGWDEAHITPGGTHFVECNNYNGVIKVYEIATGKQVHKLEIARGPVAMAPGGKTLAVGSLKDHEILLWDVVTGKELRRWKGPEDRMFSMAFSPDGRWLAAATENMVRVWWTATGELFRTFTYNEAMPQRGVEGGRLVFSLDGLWLAIEGKGGAYEIWDVLPGYKADRSFSTFGYRRSFLADGPIHLLDTSFVPGLRDGTYPFLLDIFREYGIAPLPAWAFVPVAALSRDRTMFAVPDKDGEILVARTADFFHKQRREFAIPAARIADLWRDLGLKQEAEYKSYKSFKAYRRLADGDKDVVAFLAKKLSPVKGPDARQLAKWLEGLDSNDAKVRDAARRELEAWGPAVEMSLRNAHERLGKVGRTESKSLLDKIEKKLVEEESLQTLKAIAVLAAMGTPEARQLLSRLATGAAGSRITQSARLALPRAGK